MPCFPFPSRHADETQIVRNVGERPQDHSVFKLAKIGSSVP